jgi:16S rRNA (cytidine1402-2'-O)-methyltransferase
LNDEDLTSPDDPEPDFEGELGETTLEAGLYLVGTPIGNLDDITLRALRVLKTVDRIACEDTRLTQKLLNHFGIRTPTISCHEHNEQARAAELVELLKQGGRIAVVSDAGMPGISDPGMRLARATIDAGIPVIPIPGANAALAALVASGLDTEQFAYIGFLPTKPGARRTDLDALAARYAGDTPMTLVIYEAPHRILETLADVEKVWGPSARIAVGRELTKRHEEFLRGSVAEVRTVLAARERIRGEIVLLVEARRIAVPAETSTSQIGERVAELMRAEGLEQKEALKRVARERGLSKSEVYREVQRRKSTR